MSNQNVTLSLPRSLLKQLKLLAVRLDKSLSELFRETIEERVRRESGQKQARIRQLRLLAEGLDFGTQGKLNHTRDELHER